MYNTKINGKRVSHRVSNYDELLHRWINSPELVYIKPTDYDLVGNDSYLFNCNVKFYGDNEIKPVFKYGEKEFDEWVRNSDIPIHAIINRKKKILYINDNYESHIGYYHVEQGYTIIRSKLNLRDKSFITNTNKYHELIVKTAFIYYYEHKLKYLINCIKSPKSNIVSIYSSIYTNFIIYYDNISDSMYKDLNWFLDIRGGYYGIDYHHIIGYIVENNLFNKKWLKDTIIRGCPITINDLVKDTVFTKEEKTLLEQKLIFKSYCKGFGIPFKYIQEHWDDVPEEHYDDVIPYYVVYKNYKLNVTSTDKSFVGGYKYVLREWHHKYIAIAIQQVKENCERAENNRIIAEKCFFASHDFTKLVHLWRNGAHNDSYTITYTGFKVDRDGLSGCWVTEKEYYSLSSHKSIQFRLISPDKIETSHRATINLETAKKLFDFVNSIKDKVREKGYIDFRNNNYKFDYYKLNMISFDTFIDDFIISVGCHYMEYKNFIEFIHYYKLEEYFSLTN